MKTGSLAGSGYRTREQMKISNPEREGSPTEQTTQRAEFTYNIPYGRYRIYAVANMGDLAANTRYAEKIALEEDFRRIAPAWETDPELTRNNDQMSGYFTANKPESGAVPGQSAAADDQFGQADDPRMAAPAGIEDSRYRSTRRISTTTSTFTSSPRAYTTYPGPARCWTQTTNSASRTPTTTYG